MKTLRHLATSTLARMGLGLLLGVCALVAPVCAQSTEVQWLGSQTPTFEIKDPLHALMEVRPSAGITAIAGGARGPFAPQAANTVFPMSEHHTLWIRLRLEATDNPTPGWVLTIPLPNLDHVVLYQPDGTGGWTTQVAGDTNPVSQWARPGLYPEFSLNLPTGTAHEVYLQIQNFKPMGIPIRLTTVKERAAQRELEYAAIGMVLGALLILMGSCTIQYLVTREVAEGWYALYIGLMMLVISGVMGASGQWLWPNAPTWSNHTFSAIPVLGMGATLLFVQHACALQVGYPRLGRGFQWLGWASVPLPLLGLVMDRGDAVLIQLIYLVVSPTLMIAGAALAWRRGNPVGQWLFMSYLPFGTAITMVILQNLNITPELWEARYVMVLAIAASIPMILHALHLRARMRHEAEDRASSLSRQDALTGLLIKPLFMTHVEETLERALNDKESSAIVLVEVVNHAHLREAFGEAVAEQCLLRAVVKLHRVLRDVDPAGRVDTSRFGLILEGVHSRQVLSERMVSLIASGLIPLPGLKPEATLQFHVACVMLNEIVPAANTILDQLGDVLDNISPRSRRPIRFLEPAHTVPAAYDGDSILVPQAHDNDSHSGSGGDNSMASRTSHLPAEGI